MLDLKTLREEKGMTQAQLADACGVIRQTISNIEVGLNRPSVTLAQRLGEVLDVPWYELYGNEK